MKWLLALVQHLREHRSLFNATVTYTELQDLEQSVDDIPDSCSPEDVRKAYANGKLKLDALKSRASGRAGPSATSSAPVEKMEDEDAEIIPMPGTKGTGKAAASGKDGKSSPGSPPY